MVGPACKASGSTSVNLVCLKTDIEKIKTCEHFSAKPSFDKIRDLNNFANVFVENRDDNVLDLSRSDRKFLELINDHISVNEEGKLEMSLPLKEDCDLCLT